MPKTLTTRAFCLFLGACSLVATSLPGEAFAATKKPVKKTSARVKIATYLYNPNRHYRDEKTAIEDPTTRCVTKATEAAQIGNVTRAIKDGETFGVATSTEGEFGKAYREYRDGLDTLWDAMNEPYCGFGAFGVSAAVKSYNKTATRLRTEFLAAAKNLKK